VAPSQGVTTASIIVPLVAMQFLGASTWSSPPIAPMQRWNRIDGRFEHARVALVGAAQRDRERNSLCIYDEVALRAKLAAISWVASRRPAASGSGDAAGVHSCAAPIDDGPIGETL
jgi:hypothetical protein